MVQQNLLVVGRAGDAPFANLAPLARRQDHVHQPQFAEFMEHRPGVVSQVGRPPPDDKRLTSKIRPKKF